MVNFESDNLLTTNKGDLLNYMILERRDELINSFKKYMEYSISNSSAKNTQEWKLRSCMFSLFLELERPLNRKLDPTKYDKLSSFVYKTSLEVQQNELIEMFHILNAFLDDINLIKIDTKKVFDSRNVEEENEEKGL